MSACTPCGDSRLAHLSARCRPRAYGYFHTERFLSQITQANGADTFTDGLAQWTARLWNPPTAPTQEVEALYYIDGHRKPVYADSLIPRGLIGNSGKILGCRALVLRALEDLACKEREMFELDNRKDQVMTICKVALVNLVMWTRDQYFPLTYAHATWKRLAPFFHLPGRVTQGPRAISVELHLTLRTW